MQPGHGQLWNGKVLDTIVASWLNGDCIDSTEKLHRHDTAV